MFAVVEHDISRKIYFIAEGRLRGLLVPWDYLRWIFSCGDT
jgi:hypothetical protein